MSAQRQTQIIGNGISLTEVIDNTKKTTTITAHFKSKLDSETSAEKALLPRIFTHTCKNYPTLTALNCRLAELYDTQLGYSTRCFSDNHETEAHISTIADKYALDGENLSLEVAKLFCDCLFSPMIDNDTFINGDDIELIKVELIDDINANINDKKNYALLRAGEVIYKTEPYSILSLGTVESAESITPKSLYNAYKSLLKSAHIDISITGAQVSKEAKELIISAFANISDRDDIYTLTTAISPIKKATEYSTDRLDVTQSKLVVAYKTDVADSYAIGVTCSLLGGTPVSKFFTNIREKQSLCYYCAGAYNSYKKCMIVSSGVENENIVKTQEAIQNEINEVVKGNFTDELLEQTKLYVTESLTQMYNSPYSIYLWYHDQCMKEKTYSIEEAISIVNATTRQDIIDIASSFVLDTVYVLTGKDGEELWQQEK